MRGRAWTAEDDAWLLAAFPKGSGPLTQEACAAAGAQLGRTAAAVASRILRLRYPAAQDYRKPEFDAPLPTRRRVCMTCGGGFDSEGPHHRMCESCRTGAAAHLIAYRVAL